MRSVWTGALQIGKVPIPVRLGTAVSRDAGRKARSPFRTLHAACGTPVESPTRCPACDVTLGEGETVKGLEVAAGQFVTVTTDEIKAAIDTELIVLERFVPVIDVPPILVERTYWIAPADDRFAARAYATLMAALDANDVGGLGRIAFGSGGEYVALVRPNHEHGILALQTLFLGEHVRAADAREIKQMVARVEVAAPEVNAFRAVLEQRTRIRFSADRLSSAFKPRLPALIEAKLAGGEVHTVAGDTASPVDLMERLEASVTSRRVRA